MKLLFAAAATFVAFTMSAQAASLPPPAKLCQLISVEGGKGAATWQKSAKGYYCRSDGMTTPGGQGVVFMNAFQAMGTAKSHAKSVYFHIQMFDSTLEADAISQLVLPRITNIFAASNAGPVPDALVQAITSATTASVPTTLGLARTRLTPSSNSNSNNGAVFEIEIDAP